MAGDSKDDEGFTEGTLFDMDATLEDAPEESSSFDDELEATGAWIPVQEESGSDDNSEDSADEDEGDGKTAVLSLDDVLSAEKRSAGTESDDFGFGDDSDATADESEKIEDLEEHEELEEPMEKTFVMEIDSSGQLETADDSKDLPSDEEATMALNILEEPVDETEEATVMFQIPVDEPVVRARLEGVEGPDDGGTWDLKDDSIVLGRSKECDLSVKDPTASRKHIRLTWENDSYRFEDLGSGNGTTRNGRKEERGILSDGDRIQLGQSVFVFSVLESSEKSPGPAKTEEPAQPVKEGSEKNRETASLKTMAPAIGGTVLLLLILIWYFSGGSGEEAKPEKGNSEVGSEQVDEKSAAAEGEAAYSEGLEFAKNGDWEQALISLQRAANSDPKNEVYQKALSRAEEEISHSEQFAKGVKLAEAGQLGEAIDAYRSIPDSADVFAKAAEAIRTHEQEYEATEGERIRKAILDGKYAEVKDDALTYAARLPKSEDAQGLKGAVESGKRAAVRFVKGRSPAEGRSSGSVKSTASKSKPSQKKAKSIAAPTSFPGKASKPAKPTASGAVGKALSQHRSRDTAGAISTLTKARDGGDQSPKLMKTLSDLQAFEAAYNKGKSASGSKAIKPLERAYKMDQRLGGNRGNEIAPILSDRLGNKAAEYYAKEIYGSAAITARKALKYDRDHVNAAQVVEKCQKKAVEFYNRGMESLEKGNNTVAKTFLKLAIDILPRGDGKRANAQKALESL